MNKLIFFILGASLGSLVTYKIVEEKFKNIANEDIESVREYYKNKYSKYLDEDNYIDFGVYDIKENSEQDENKNLISNYALKNLIEKYNKKLKLKKNKIKIII